ncbi:hypothetical protein L1F30_01905 [Simiduia sp. 21SJ11W-1]|uniref:hypothetical protein n=1 Tax=Simiduia sp. 21SJ11W-1 TaxID=2909669 RepID=UPI00209FD5A5|nr:hypothetical protein [Simiduia sp. 21SJ11W-1]UTA48309.1 hypothetical protein L1F30_01905 [Simiduia sp. 21SJ11W-1]
MLHTFNLRFCITALLIAASFNGYGQSKDANTECEATIIEGTHTHANPSLAIAGALEEAQDSCYPGDAQALTTDCQSTTNLQGKAVHQCTQSVTCNLCGDDLRRKYEALD